MCHANAADNHARNTAGAPHVTLLPRGTSVRERENGAHSPASALVRSVH
jgi:hypothetical protein